MDPVARSDIRSKLRLAPEQRTMGGPMPKYEVIQPIEVYGTLYLPENENAPRTAKSFSHGREIAVDASGLIELTAEEAAAIPHALRPLKRYPVEREGGKKK
jgi:hypothetical protein